MAAERMRKHEEHMQRLKEENDKALAKLTNKELDKTKKAAVLVKENTTDRKEKMHKEIEKVESIY